MAVDVVARAMAAGKVPVTAYEYAVQAGYTGTEEQFAQDMGNSGTNATNAANSATAAAASATTAANAAGNLAPAYSASATYAVGDHVLYDGGYYVCNTAITTAEAWTAAHWTAAKVGPEITDLKTHLAETQIQTNPTARLIITSGRYWKGNVNETISDGAQNTYNKYDLIPCRSGDQFFLHVSGSSSAAPYYILDASKTILSKGSGAVNETITISDSSASYLAVNHNTNASFTPSVYLITETENQISSLQSSTNAAITNVQNEIDAVKTDLSLTQIQTNPTERLVKTSGKYWKGNVSETISTGSLGGYDKYELIRCRKGDQFHLKIRGSSSAPAYCILDQNKTILSKASESTINTTITVSDDNAYYLALNNNTNVIANPEIYLVTETRTEIATLASDITTLASDITTVSNKITYLTDFINVADMIKRVRAGSKTFSYEGMNSGYLTIIFDDGRHDLSTVASICAEYNIPLCAAIPTNALSNTCDNGDTVKEVCESIVANGGEILSHGVQSSVLTSATDYEWLKRELGTSKQILAENGFNIRGFIKPGGTGAIPWDGNNLQRFTQLFYDYANSCGDDAEYKKARIHLGYPIETLKGYIDDAALNNKWFTTFSHTLDGTEDDLNEAKFRTIIEYALSKNILFKTYAYMYDTFGTWS